MDTPETTVSNRVGSGDSLRRCNRCFSPQTAGVRLRRCGGCSTVVYCSLECQKVQWPLHKPLCRAETTEDAAKVACYGYASLGAFSRDLDDFMDAHEWAFRMLITMERQLQRDRNPDVPFSELPMLLRFSLRCQTTRSDTHQLRNPAMLFALVSQTFEDLDAFARKNKNTYAQTASTRESAHRNFVREFPHYTGQIFAVEHRVPGTNHASMHFYPIETPLAPALGTPQQRRPISEDMVDFCKRSINDGFPMGMNVSGGFLAYPGTFVRLGKAICEEWES
ncbi:hypothetical protein K466DRAFT_77323 [Polyporus arcularius HHB13444]|uniref:MYND-type domain-containing protein n=1 Tax=Polyporus arcularius HHB13444 TaxID=1314778 RepID=A0A5C3PJ84_9APHY|nr:hypothetical protein K466DRAFT_77323 [Polyporus arcularius HHB13444]